MYDIIIIGAGPAGLSAGIYALRANKKVLIIEKSFIGGQVALLGDIFNYPAFEQIDGFSLAQKMKQQATKLGAEIVMQEVKSVNLTDKTKIVTTYSQSYESKAVIIATGAYSKPLNLPNEKEFFGKGLSYCATCDGNFFKGKDVAIVGSGTNALNDCSYLANLAKNLYIIFTHDAPNFNAQNVLANVKIFDNTNVKSINGQGVLSEICLESKTDHSEKTLKVDGLFVNLGKKPYTHIFDGVALNEAGYIITDQNMRTNIKNVYAVGDVRNTPLKQIVTACADGAVAVSTFIAEN
ncbi:MAG: FAD-dependent oxidoreductase [Clostridia bacterium]|nr:FAD-dependent oxidoreductase [Clostridia bacterium]